MCASLLDEQWSAPQIEAFLKRLETSYKKPFPPIGEESLAGGLSNTIGGRICNYFNLQGGGYTVDGACASSLLAVANACTALVAGDLDLALAGGVDLSLDPFELVGFAKTGALASTMMRVYDRRSDGFWPGEGCGFVLLMRHEDALAEHRQIYAVIRGWGISSDGNGGITRPEIEGQLLALKRAYKRSGLGIETVPYFEGHGTGTSVGDTTELRALSRARREAASNVPPAVIGSIKANIGHTKAAAGIAGLIKAVMALKAGILPPTTGCEEPHPELKADAPALRVLEEGEPWPINQHLRAGVSSMGFGGINAHLVMECDGPPARRRSLGYRERSLLSSAQDAELFLLGANSADELQLQIAHLSSFAAQLSRAELADLSAHLERTLDRYQVRAAIVASSPAELAVKLEALKKFVAAYDATRSDDLLIDTRAGVFFGTGRQRRSLGFLFPGQGSPSHLSGGILRRRFSAVQELYPRAQFAAAENETATAIAQPAIVTASMAALRVLSRLDINASIAVGHSLGELTALHWAGAFDEEALLRIASVRGRAMTETNGHAGAMASITASGSEVETLLNGDRVVIAGLNSPSQTVLSGDIAAITAVMERAAAKKLSAVRLPVSHAFHSPLVAAAAPFLAEHLAGERFNPLERNIVSTITGGPLPPETNLRELLERQITSPVLFMDAAKAADAQGVGLWLEVGPGKVLRGLMAQLTETPVVSLDAGGPSMKGVLQAVGAVFVLGHPVNHAALFADRFVRPFNPDRQPKFFVNPCELAPAPELTAQSDGAALTPDLETTMEASMDGAEQEEFAPVDMARPGSASALEVVTRLVAARAELPPSAVSPESRLLSDLHLNSITVGQIVAEAARRLGLPRPVSPTDFAPATVAEVAEALDVQLRVAPPAHDDEKNNLPAGIDSWFRPFSVELVERPLSRRRTPPTKGTWRVLAPPHHPLAASLQRAFDDCGAGNGVVLCLPPAPDENHLALLLEGARAVIGEQNGARFVLVQHGGGAAAFARTLHLEAPHVMTRVVDVPYQSARAVEWVIAEALTDNGHVEAHYDADGRRREPFMKALPLTGGAAALPLGTEDVVVVTGGGKGITAECALKLACETGARLALFGRAQPEEDAELAENLQRMKTAGIAFRYIAVDVTDAQAVKAALQQVTDEFGPVTALIHGAARNVPQLLSQLDEETFRRTMAVKVGGARHLLAAIDPEKLRLFVAFGSIIARTGLPGEGDYGLANEWLTRLTEEWQVNHPHCRCLAVEWSIWSGVGMGARLGRIDLLVNQGIIPIPPDEGVAILRQLLMQSRLVVPVVVMGRFPEMPTFRIEQPELPLLRFLEQPRIYYPDVELVVDVELSTDTDPYLNDHQVQGERLLPAVMGLEAMAQVATALARATMPPIFQEVKFNRPLLVPETGSLKMRIAALVREAGLLEVAIRSEETAFQVDHFRALCRFQEAATLGPEIVQPLFDDVDTGAHLALDPEHDLYGSILFQRGRFRRVSGYKLLKARECLAEIAPDGSTAWFSQYLPDELILGDPGMHDATIHAVQACIPHAMLLPIGADRVSLGTTQTSTPLFVHATERSQADNTFTYDIEVLEADGCVRERWEGLRLRAVNSQQPQGAWAISVLAPYVERRVRELIEGSAVTVALESGEGQERRAQSDRAIQMALGEKTKVLRRPDGKPEVAGGRTVSAAHSGNLTLAVAGTGLLGCDIERVVERPAHVWKELLGEKRAALSELIAREVPEETAISATRAWAAVECLQKAGAGFDAPLLFASAAPDGWVLLSSGRLKIATYAAHVREDESRLVIAVLLESRDESV
jgi:enediyne polyketide synthase